MTDAKFLGGEPFMIEIYLSIWERILKINPGIRMHITTNGTFLNSRIKKLLEGLNAGIIISIDSVEKETYKKIRINGNYDKVMENLDYFIDYTRRKKTFISMAACPMTNNWRELPQMLEFCLSRNIALYFNAVFTPEELSLRDLSSKDLGEVISFLENYSLPEISSNPQSPRNLSIRAYSDFILLLKGWQNERKMGLSGVMEITTKQDIEWSLEAISDITSQMIELQSKGITEGLDELQNQLAALFVKTPKGRIAESQYCLIQCADKYFNKTPDNTSFDKLKRLAVLIEEHPHRENILNMSSHAPAFMFASLIAETGIEDLEKIFFAQFSSKL